MPSCNANLKTFRLRAGLSLNKLAALASLDRATVTNAEKGKDVTELTISKLSDALSKALGTSVLTEAIQKKGS